MKKIFFSRKTILRAIHAACVSLLLLATEAAAQAQTTFGSGTFANPSTNNLSTSSSYTNASPITLTDASESGSYFADATVSKNITVFVDYETQAGQQNSFAQSAQGGVKIGF